jgi:hypothetical protein
MIGQLMRQFDHKPITQSKIKSAMWIAFKAGYLQNYTDKQDKYVLHVFESWFEENQYR